MNNRSRIWKNSLLTSVARMANLLNVQSAIRLSQDRRYYDSTWCYTREASGSDLNVTIVEERSDIAVI